MINYHSMRVEYLAFAASVLAMLFLCGCTELTGRRDTTQYDFVADKALLEAWSWDYAEHPAEPQQVDVVNAFVRLLSRQSPSEVIVIEGFYVDHRTVFAVVSAEHEDDLYYLLEVSHQGKPLRYTTIPMA